MPRFHGDIREGTKTRTFRSKRYGQPGDRLKTPCGVIKLLAVTRTTAAFVRDNHWQDEGCDSPEDFVQVWTIVHPRKGFDPDYKGYLHHFEYEGAT
jgi:hypothetical protein